VFASIFQFEKLLKSIFMLHNRNYKIAKMPDFINFLVHNAKSPEIKKVLILLASLSYGNYGIMEGIPQPPHRKKEILYILLFLLLYIFICLLCSSPPGYPTITP